MSNLIREVFVHVPWCWWSFDQGKIAHDIQLAKDIGINFMILNGQQFEQSAKWDTIVNECRKTGMKFGLSPVHTDSAHDTRTDELNVKDVDVSVQEAGKLASILAQRYAPDAWYIDMEFPIEYPALKDDQGNYIEPEEGLWADRQMKVIQLALAARVGDIYLSPFYGTYGDLSRTASVKYYFDIHMKRLAVQPTIRSTYYLALQDGVGCNYLTPRRIIGTPAYADLLEKFKACKQVAETYGWRFRVNCELFDLGGQYPSTFDRIMGQFNGMDGIGVSIGPCFEYSAYLSPLSLFSQNKTVYDAYKTYYQASQTQVVRRVTLNGVELRDFDISITTK